MEKTNEILTIAGKKVVVRYTKDGHPCEKCVLDGTKGCNSTKCSLLDRVGMEIDERAYFVHAEEGKILPKLREFLATATPEELEAKYRELEYLLAPKDETADTDKLEVDIKAAYDKQFWSDPVFSNLVNRNAGLAIARYFAEWGAKHLKR